MTNDQDDQMSNDVIDHCDNIIDEDDFSIVPRNHASSDIGPVFLEGVLHDIPPSQDTAPLINQRSLYLQEDLEKRLSSISFTFELSKDILADGDNAPSALGYTLYEYCKRVLAELKVVEYNGTQTRHVCYSAPGTTIRVQLYTLNTAERVSEEGSILPQAEIMRLPNVRFSDRWDELVFEEDHKREVIRIVTNILRFSQPSSQGSDDADMSPIIMLHGPPGTGKTSLCEALAQKISIRLSQTYNMTSLVQIKSATLLSKYFSESAKVIEEVFTKLAQMCQEKPDEFLCVLIDEVESLAMSRDTSTRQGECHDSLRAVNALLTGLDRTKGYRNIIFLCTSNMIGFIESAFLDRCGLLLAINHPSPASQYAILRGKIRKLIDRKRVYSEEDIPYYDEALVDARIANDKPGSKLLQIVELIRSNNEQSSPNRVMSGRLLAQLPGQAILRYLRQEQCDLDMLFRFMKQSLLSERGRDVPVGQSEDEAESRQRIEAGSIGRKRKIHLIIEEPNEEDLEDCKRFLRTMRHKQ
ncbi:uncharacterized protein BP5553_06259 [Venustampulla echinocandica]|uniref:AAA+ ATPase domain-containing protein n=1 Tax=Venustampulla echinocandica TaxID=2656787 RepID=A0A370TN19_9HELO|nr:uncharacterized protein BP5553_06259 [Venustampulla echinocandica]RDL36907.1 hypothetical protein BP5553_06259 [Venustampulla echinocandica]